MAALGIAFEAQEINVQPRPSGGRPIDLVHLARQTGGDKALESEVLALFADHGHEGAAVIGRMQAGAPRITLA